MFLYLNSGYAELFVNSSFEESYNYEYNNKNSISVYDGSGIIKLSNIVDGICGKFDFYISSSSFNFIIGVGGSELNNGFVLEVSDGVIFYQCRYNTPNAPVIKTINYDSNMLNVNATNSIFFYIVPSTSKYAGFIKIVINNVDIISSYVDLDFECSNIEIYSENSNVFLSNFIFSDEVFDYSCEVFSPQLNIEEDTDMILQQGTYVASQVEQKVIQSIDVDDLILQYGRNANVLGIAIAGMSAYSSLTNVGAMASVEKYNSKYLIREQIGLSNNKQDYIMDSELLQNMKLNSFINRTYGWIAKL